MVEATSIHTVPIKLVNYPVVGGFFHQHIYVENSVNYPSKWMDPNHLPKKSFGLEIPTKHI